MCRSLMTKRKTRPDRGTAASGWHFNGAVGCMGGPCGWLLATFHAPFYWAFMYLARMAKRNEADDSVPAAVGDLPSMQIGFGRPTALETVLGILLHAVVFAAIVAVITLLPNPAAAAPLGAIGVVMPQIGLAVGVPVLVPVLGVAAVAVGAGVLIARAARRPAVVTEPDPEVEALRQRNEALRREIQRRLTWLTIRRAFLKTAKWPDIPDQAAELLAVEWEIDALEDALK